MPTSTNTPTCIAGCTISPTPRPTPTRRRAKACGAFSTPARVEEIVFTRSATEAINLVAVELRPRPYRRGRRDRALGHGAPRQYRALAFPSRAQGRGAEMGRCRRRRLVLAGSLRAGADAAHQDRRDHADVERARHGRRRSRRSSRIAHARGIPVLVDGSQGAVHLRRRRARRSTSISTSFTGHKLYGPTGIGVLYGKAARLEALPPFNGGGEMIEEVTRDASPTMQPPHRFEAGTPPIVAGDRPRRGARLCRRRSAARAIARA